MSDKLRVLFICVHNSARSQMAETFLRDFAGDQFEVESAGLTPTEVNPLVIEVMDELGFDLAGNTTQSVFDLYKQGKIYDYVITVCDDAIEEECPTFPGVTNRWHWPFQDPAKAQGSHEEKLKQVRDIRDQIKVRVENPFGQPFKIETILPGERI